MFPREGRDALVSHTPDSGACPDLGRSAFAPCAAFSDVVFRVVGRDRPIPAVAAGSGPAAGECAAIVAALRTSSPRGAACGVRFCRRRQRRTRHDAGALPNRSANSGHHGGPGTVRGPERPQPVPGSTNAPAPSLGRSAQGVGSARARQAGEHKPDYAGLGAKGVGSDRSRLA